ncbi:MAG: YjbQ family protein [Actinobacteria bacterium]|nr:MAG: YjbQ family protein [Actinomycetota bacterium]
MLRKISIKTKRKNEFVSITDQVNQAIKDSGLSDGLAHIYCPHTTAGITINENYDPSVVGDIISHLGKLVPENAGYRHSEGNSDGHIKSSLIGSSVTVIIDDTALLLGQWQGIFFCEFDGPRNRSVWIKLVKD